MATHRKFKVGDRVRVIDKTGPHSGAVTVITGEHPSVRHEETGEAWPGYEVDLPTTKEYQAAVWPRAWFWPDQLEPYYDGNEKVSWSDCVWQPNKLSARSDG